MLYWPCKTCNIPLPLRAARPGEASLPWTCSHCGTRYHGMIAARARLRHLENVKPADDGQDSPVHGARLRDK